MAKNKGRPKKKVNEPVKNGSKILKKIETKPEKKVKKIEKPKEKEIKTIKKPVKKKPKILKKEKTPKPEVEIKLEERKEKSKEEKPEPKPKEVVEEKVKEVPKVETKKIKKKKSKHKTSEKEEIKPKKKVGGGSFIASGILSILVPAAFYIMLGDFSSFLNECTLPFGTVDIGSDTVLSCTELRFVYVLSFLFVFFGSILVILGVARKILEMKKSFKNA